MRWMIADILPCTGLRHLERLSTSQQLSFSYPKELTFHGSIRQGSLRVSWRCRMTRTIWLGFLMPTARDPETNNAKQGTAPKTCPGLCSIRHDRQN
jgi:hypothetical protein